MPEVRSYHGQPVIKEPVWTWEIPCYFYTGGMGGAAAGLSFLADLRGNHELARRSWLVALAGTGVSPLLLTSDLGKPMRFLNMLRMFKVTSPMSVGSWVLTWSGLTTAAAMTHEWTGIPTPAGRFAKPLAAVLGLPLSTYTAALIANTAVPAWHEARRELPFVFAAGAALSAGGAVAAATPTEAAAPARRLALVGAVAELGLEHLMERRLGDLGQPYHEGLPHRLAQLSRVTIGAGAALMAARGGRSRTAAVVAGALMNAGALATRWSIFKAGFKSASDPKYVVGPQRARIERGESAGAARREPRLGAAAAAGDGRGSPATAEIALPTPDHQR